MRVGEAPCPGLVVAELRIRDEARPVARSDAGAVARPIRILFPQDVELGSTYLVDLGLGVRRVRKRAIGDRHRVEVHSSSGAGERDEQGEERGVDGVVVGRVSGVVILIHRHSGVGVSRDGRFAVCA